MTTIMNLINQHDSSNAHWNLCNQTMTDRAIIISNKMLKYSIIKCQKLVTYAS